MESDPELDNIHIVFVIAVILITGGWADAGLMSAEIFNPVTIASCSLPQLPEGRYGHSENEGLICGGTFDGDTQKTCVKWSPNSGTWKQSDNLRHRRAGHVSWVTASGVYLIGGSYSLLTSEKMKLDGSIEEGFGLKYETK